MIRKALTLAMLIGALLGAQQAVASAATSGCTCITIPPPHTNPTGPIGRPVPRYMTPYVGAVVTIRPANRWQANIMGIIFRKRVPLSRSSWLNVSRSGVSASKRTGRVTVNSRGQGRVRIAKGLSFRFKL